MGRAVGGPRGPGERQSVGPPPLGRNSKAPPPTLGRRDSYRLHPQTGEGRLQAAGQGLRAWGACTSLYLLPWARLPHTISHSLSLIDSSATHRTIRI